MSIFHHVVSPLQFQMPYCSKSRYDFQLANEIFQKPKSEGKKYVKGYESEKSNRNYVGKCKNSRKEKRKSSYGNSKNISAKNNFTPNNSTVASSMEL